MELSQHGRCYQHRLCSMTVLRIHPTQPVVLLVLAFPLHDMPSAVDQSPLLDAFISFFSTCPRERTSVLVEGILAESLNETSSPLLLGGTVGINPEEICRVASEGLTSRWSVTNTRITRSLLCATTTVLWCCYSMTNQ